MPLLFSTRPTDVHYRLDSLRKTYSLVPPALLHLAVRVGLGHSHPHGWSPPEIVRFADHTFRATPALPRAMTPTLSEGGRSLTGSYAKLKLGLPLQAPRTLPGLPAERRTELTKISSDAEVDCYRLRVGPVATIGDGNRIRIYVVENGRVIDDKLGVRSAVSVFGEGVTRLQFQKEDFR
jgi:hypothetical protein